MSVAVATELAVRIVIVVFLAYAVAVAATHWAVQRRHLQPFGAWPRFVRRASDPVLAPIERRLVRMGKNPQDAPLWLLGLVILAGLLLLALVGWLIDTAWRLGRLGSLGPEAWVLTLVGWIFGLLMIALIVRVVSTWFGISPYARWMRPVVFLTEWLLAPIRRRMPPLGMLDLSPLVAYFALVLLRFFVTRIFAAVL
jgi:YggT family protein